MQPKPNLDEFISGAVTKVSEPTLLKVAPRVVSKREYRQATMVRLPNSLSMNLRQVLLNLSREHDRNVTQQEIIEGLVTAFVENALRDRLA